MAGERVLVTGGNGVIGAWVVRELSQRGVDAVVLDRSPRPALVFPEVAASAPIVVGDVRDAALLRSVLGDHGISRVIHLAAIIGEACDEDPTEAIDINATGSARVFDAAAAAGVARIVANSTKGVLGPLDRRYLHPSYEPVPPTLAPSPRNLYEASKYLVEPLVAHHRARGLSAAAMRLSTTWGPGKSGATHGAFGFHSDIVKRAVAGERSELDTSPEQGFDLIYYPDIAAGIVAAALTPGELRSPVYHLGAGRITTMGEFTDAVRAACPGADIRLGDRLAAGRNCLLDITASTADFGYVPAWPADAAVGDFVARLRSPAPTAAFAR
jgi:UDP-glucose 4-epimerase